MTVEYFEQFVKNSVEKVLIYLSLDHQGLNATLSQYADEARCYIFLP